MDINKLQIEQIEAKMLAFKPVMAVSTLPTGWVKAIRLALGMSMRQLANRLGITKQSIQEMELREKNGSITLNSLREAANALDMELVYGFVPKDGSLENLIDRKARELATRIVSRTSQSMLLEDQKVDYNRYEEAIEDRAQKLRYEMPKILWD
jgi:predicted DNA-binding mobile mystery protein A